MSRLCIILSAAILLGSGAAGGDVKDAGGIHTADQNADHEINLSELLRVVQFYNSNGYHCAAGTEDGYAPGPGDQSCSPHAIDYNTQNWRVSMSELLRLIQFYNSHGYQSCVGSEDGYCAGKSANVVFLLIDTLRADRIGASHNDIPITPFLAAFAQSGAYFRQATAPSSWTRPSMAALFTGKYTEALHGNESTAAGDRYRLWPEYETITEWLVAQGYDAWGMQTNSWCTAAYGYDQGFGTGRYSYSFNARAGLVTDNVLAHIDEWHEPFFIFALYFDPHGAYDPLPAYSEVFGPQPAATPLDLQYLNPANWTNYVTDVYRAWYNKAPQTLPPLTANGEAAMRYRYNAEVRYTDEQVQRLVQTIQARYPRTIFVIVADHGEELLDHGALGHGFESYEEQSRVPLIVSGLGVAPAVIDFPVESGGLLPTLAGLLKQPLNPDWQTKDYFSFTGEEAVFSYTWTDFDSVVAEASLVKQGSLKYVVHNRFAPRLFDLSTDPGELTDVAAERPADVATLSALLAQHKLAVTP